MPSADDEFYEQRYTQIKTAEDEGRIADAVRLTVNTVDEGTFTGPDATDQTFDALAEAGKRIERRH